MKESIAKLIDVGFDTLKADRLDLGLAVFVEKPISVVAGGRVSDGAAMEESIKKLATMIEGEGDIPPVQWNAETYKGYRFHKVSIRIPDPSVAAFVGEQVDVILAVNDGSSFLAVGGSADARLKKTIDDSEAGKSKVAAMMYMEFKLGPIFNAAAEMNPAAGMFAAMLTEGGSIVITSSMLPNGALVRLEVQEKVLEALGSAGGMFMGGLGGPSPGGPPPGAPF